MSADQLHYRLIHPVKHYHDHLEHNIRPDGRQKTEFRPVGINCFHETSTKPAIQTADGSAIIKMGNTTVVCGIKAELAQPKAVEPDRGFIVPNIELTPLCASRFRPGAPTEEAQMLAQSLADIVMNCKCFDLKQLIIAKDSLAWVLYCDVVCLNYDGCVLDAAVLAIMAALKTVTLPVVVFNSELKTYRVDHDSRIQPFRDLDTLPISTTFITFSDMGVIVDPTADEEDLSNGSITIAVHKTDVIFTLKAGGATLTADDFNECTKVAISRAEQLQSLVQTVVK